MEFNLGLKQLENSMAASIEAVQSGKVYERALGYLGQKSVEYARANTPVKTGRLRDGWRYEVDTRARTVQLKNDVPYAQAVNDGHRQEPGRYVPGIGADGQGRRLKGAYVKGQHMLEKAGILVRSYEMEKAAAMVLEDLRRELGR